MSKVTIRRQFQLYLSGSSLKNLTNISVILISASPRINPGMFFLYNANNVILKSIPVFPSTGDDEFVTIINTSFFTEESMTVYGHYLDFPKFYPYKRRRKKSQPLIISNLLSIIPQCTAVLPSSLVLATNPGMFHSNDRFDWSQFGCVLSLPNNTVGVSETGKITTLITFLTLSRLGKVIRQTELDGSGGCPQPVGGGRGNFEPGTYHIISHHASDDDIGTGPISFTFSHCVRGVGAQMATNFNGEFTAQLQAFDSRGILLQTVTRQGFKSFTANNVAIFLGIYDSTATIKSIVFSIIACEEHSNDFLVSTLFIG